MQDVSQADPVPLLRLVPLTRAHAEDICTWRYPAPYDCYDMTGAHPDGLLAQGTGCWALTTDDRLVGFRSFGRDGQVPGWQYDDSALDTGGGLRPELVGRGWGRRAISTGLALGRELHAPAAFRVTVASFNLRALRTVQSLGFVRIAQFHASPTGQPFDVLIRSES